MIELPVLCGKDQPVQARRAFVAVGFLAPDAVGDGGAVSGRVFGRALFFFFVLEGVAQAPFVGVFDDPDVGFDAGIAVAAPGAVAQQSDTSQCHVTASRFGV